MIERNNMNLEEKIKYYNCFYEENGLPLELETTDFFNEELLDYLKGKKYNIITIKYDDFNRLLSDQLLFNKAINLLFNYNITEINSNNFYELIVSNNNLYDYVSNKIINDSIDFNFIKLLRDKRTLELLKSLVESNPSFFVKVIKSLPTNKLKDFLNDSVWNKIYCLIDYDKFFSDIKVLGVDTIGIDNITKKISSLNYNETINVLIKYYNVENNEPSYLKEVYKTYEHEIRKYKIGKLLEGINDKSSEEVINKAKEIVSSNIGMDVLLSSFKLDKFEKIAEILELKPEIKDLRKNYLLQILNNYENYNLDTVKNVFSLYYFEEIYINVMIDISVILKYASKDEEARKILGSQEENLKIIYNYLNENNNINPQNIMKDYSINTNTINEIMNKLYDLFNKDVNKNISSETVLKNATSKEKNGVVIYHLNNANDGMFLIHSISRCDENYHKNFLEKAKHNNKICMSLLDSNHTNTFLGGIIFGYLNIQSKLYSATVIDGQTNQRISLLRQYNSDLIPVKQFMNSTSQSSYNELTYLTNNEQIMPSYILCIDREPNELEMKIAKDFEIPIYVYPKKKINKLPDAKIEHKSYDYETSRIQIVPNNLSKKITIIPDEFDNTLDEFNIHKI